MLRNVGRETDPEVELRSALHRAGLRFRKDYCPLPGYRIRVDVAFPQSRVCVFLDGCFWHGCPVHFAVPKRNSDWWKEKIDDNRQRDARQTVQLKKRGWRVFRLWEHEMAAGLPAAKLERIKNSVQRRAARLQLARGRAS